MARRYIGGLITANRTAQGICEMQNIFFGTRRLSLSAAIDGRTTWDLDANGALNVPAGSYTITTLCGPLNVAITAIGGTGGLAGGSGYWAGSGGLASSGVGRLPQGISYTADTAAAAANFYTGSSPGGGNGRNISFGGAGAGGYSGLRYGASSAALIAAGGGGAGWGANGGGAGGGSTGTAGSNYGGTGGGGGTQGAGGAAGTVGSGGSAGNAGSAFQGGATAATATGFSGGGGGGYYGGGSGGSSSGGGSGGGGGSGYFDPNMFPSGALTSGVTGVTGNTLPTAGALVLV